MALRRKRKKDRAGNLIPAPVLCGICKDAETLHTVHGGIATSRVGGRACCDACFEKLKQEENRTHFVSSNPSEAEYEISHTWGI